MNDQTPISANDPETALAKAPMPAGAMEGFGRFSKAVACHYFPAIPVSDATESTIREACLKGDVVHVMHSSMVLGALFLSWFLPTRGLAPLKTAIGLKCPFWKPLKSLVRKGTCAQRIDAALDGTHSALVFLNTQSGLVPRATALADPFFALVAKARAAKRPLLLIPETFVWSARPPSLRPGLKEFLLGSAESPHRLVSAWGFAKNYRNTYFRTGKVLDLTELVALNPNDTDEMLVHKARGVLSQALMREYRAIAGPPAKPRERLIEETLRDRELRAAIEDAAVEKNRSTESQTKTARRYLREIASKPQLPMMKFIVGTMDMIFRRIFLSVEVDEPGFEKALEASRKAPVIYCPSHKSHLDYLLIGWLFVERGLLPTLVAAGANLSFFPLGFLLRRGGAYFLRRTFKGNRLYATAFRTYIKQLMKEGYNQEFFIEGGRSRTGKTLKPKLGMVDFVVTGFFEGAQDDVTFVPVALDYEKVLELKSYMKELTGGEKEPESIKSLLTAPKALASRYGRIYISFGQPFSLKEFVLNELGSLETPTVEKRYELTRKLAERITFGIDGASTVTPAALIAAAILSSPDGRCSSAELERVIRMLMDWVARGNGRLSHVLKDAPVSVRDKGPIRTVLRMWQSDRLIEGDVQGTEIYFHVPCRQRLELSFYKNNLLHAVLHPAVLASIILASPADADGRRAISMDALKDLHGRFCEALRTEFSFSNEVTFGQLMERAVESLVAEGLLAREGDQVVASGASEADLRRFAVLIGDIQAGYLLAAINLGVALSPVSPKDLVKKTIDAARSQIPSDSRLVPEALSKTVLASAVDYFVSEGVLTKVKDGKQVVLSDAFKDEGARAAHVQNLFRFMFHERPRDLA